MLLVAYILRSDSSLRSNLIRLFFDQTNINLVRIKHPLNLGPIFGLGQRHG
jgi:hypothetical protein